MAAHNQTSALKVMDNHADRKHISLSCLSNELLFRIFRHFEASDDESPDLANTKTLCALCKVSTRVHLIAQDLLYRHCWLYFDVPDSDKRVRDAARFSDVNSFIRTLAWRPQLYRLVRSVHCRLADVFAEGWTAVNDLLAQLPNIRFVTLESTYMWSTPRPGVQKAYMPDFLAVNPAPMLDTFQITGGITDMSGFLRLMTTGTIQSLIMHDFSATHVPQACRNMQDSTHLPSLTIRRTRLAVNVLHALISRTPYLKHLIVDNAFWHEPVAYETARPRRSREWRPSLIYVAIAQVRDTLETLTISETVGNWNHRESYSMNFQDFSRLRRLSVTSICFFGFETVYFAVPSASSHCSLRVPRGREKRGFWALLPPHLESLTLQFPHSTGMFYDDFSGAEDFYGRDSQPVEEYEWVEEIAAHKTSHVPCLKEIRLLELPLGYETGLSHSWVQPYSVQRAYAEHHIELEVKLRTYPKPLG
ncbi:hypothetical protein EJ05DRAFT_496152 [Pseudovirgaria hyperparasitica]|uniref:Uncharacterized protein n=1 Tax=Pseudovirgaria hyperparasitica TaxID=470096 RepID=A0A6A6WMG9_9PEZI|nr:uncharacterized protein EJ05DRAFT_496152 [Pseudovirgaria hyperparasitica]KAF2763326.1 hypothetical protein EJ05DRAFT_496152 [Pseudovirgaria hyperparasitica]